MPAILLCALLLCATTVGWAQGASTKNATGAAPQGRRQALKVIRASLDQQDGWESLGTLADSAAMPDRSLAAPAARIASELAHRIDVFDLDEQEIPRATLQEFQVRWLRVAANTDRWVDIRIYALDVAAQLEALLSRHGARRPGALWRTFLDDADPQMRAAALILVPPAPELGDAALALLTDARSEEVSLAAGQRLCGPLGSAPTFPPSLAAKAMGRLQKLASDGSLPIIARADLASCLLAEGSPQSRRVLGLLLQKSPPALRRTLRALSRTARPAPVP